MSVSHARDARWRTDFRSRPSDSYEGRVIARTARDDYLGRGDASDGPDDPSEAMAALGLSEELLGFWLLWHVLGGFDALERYGMHRSTIWRKVRRFRSVTGSHPDEFKFDGITVSLEDFWDGPWRAWVAQSQPASIRDERFAI